MAPDVERWLGALSLRAIGLAALTFVACHRALPVQGSSASDAGSDRAAFDASDALDATADAASEAGRDALADGPVICPVGVAPVDVCGCGCCGAPQQETCYYPALGESASTIANPVPPPASCANVGCSGGVRHVCCLPPGPQPAELCADDRSIEDLLRFAIIRRDGTVCTTLMFDGGSTAFLPIEGPSGYWATLGARGPCDGSAPRASAIGAAGSASWHVADGGVSTRVVDIHAALFFDDGTGIATAVRLDADGLAIQSTHCPYGTP